MKNIIKTTSRAAFFHPRVLIGFVLCSVGLLLAFAGLSKSVTGMVRHEATAQTSGTWAATGSMNTARWNSTATPLNNGKILVTGGVDASGNATASAELYDSSTGTWTPTASMSTARSYFAATLLPNGKVLVAGGENNTGAATSSAEIYDPGTGLWSPTGNMTTPRTAHMASLITTGPLSGKVLVAGGSSICAGCTPIFDTAELYDPSTGLWADTGSMTIARLLYPLPTATLPDGSVLIVGGVTCCPYHWFNKAESYDPISQTWAPTSTKMTTANETPILLPDGKVLVAGGVKGTQPTSKNVADAELFDPAMDTWVATASMSADRNNHTLTLLPSGQVLVAGGYSGGWGVCNDLTSAELYDSSAGKWLPTGDMTVPRYYHTATLLPNGQVLAAGGTDCEGHILSSAELYTPATTNDSCMSPPAGLVSWWAGDEDSSDLQGNNAGILKNGASYAAGFVSRAGFSFDGANDGVQVGDTPSLKMTTAMTLECWIFPTGPGSINPPAPIAGKEGEYQFARMTDGTIFWAFANTDPGWVWTSAGYVAPERIWTHIAVTFDNGLITSYANGVQVSQYAGSGPIGDVLPTLNDFRIGNRQQFPAPFDGTVDELKVYNRALSSSEVAAIYSAGSSGNCKPEVFVQDISPYAIPKTGGVYKVGTTIKIMDSQGHSISDAIVRVTVVLPDGGSFSDAVTTDSDGNADYSIFSSTHGTYVFRVELVRKLGRQYSRQSNVETRDQITIP